MNSIRNKHIYFTDDFDTSYIQELNGNYVYLTSLKNDYDIYNIFITFINSHIFYNNTEYITDEEGFVEEQKPYHMDRGELMRVDEKGIIKTKNNVFIIDGNFLERNIL